MVLLGGRAAAAAAGRERTGSVPPSASGPLTQLASAALSSVPLAAWPADPTRRGMRYELVPQHYCHTTHPFFVLQRLLLELLKYRVGGSGQLSCLGRTHRTGNFQWGAPRGALLEGDYGRSSGSRMGDHRDTRRRLGRLRTTTNYVSCRSSLQWGWLL